MKEKGVLHYIKYAVGEILLVVIGILIAVGINNWNEGKKQRKELMNIYEAVKINLENDVKEIEDIFELYNNTKVYFKKAINDSLTQQDYFDHPTLAFLTISFPEFTFDTRGFNLISDYNNSRWGKPDSLMANIVHFYTEHMREIKVDDDLRAKDFDENFSYYKNNFSWWSDLVHKKEIKDFVHYALNDKDYKNRISTTYFITYEIFLPELKEFEKRAKKLIDDINQRLL